MPGLFTQIQEAQHGLNERINAPKTPNGLADIVADQKYIYTAHEFMIRRGAVAVSSLISNPANGGHDTQYELSVGPAVKVGR